VLYRLLLLAALLLLPACHGPDGVAAPRTNTPVYVMMQTSAGDIILILDQERAPVTVANFLDHAARHHYDDTIFHRVIPSFVIQGGGWTPDFVERARTDAAEGSPDKPIRNEWRNGLKNNRGTIAMAREADPDSATREFYINVADNAKLDSGRPTTGDAGYAVFGHVAKGMHVVDAIKDGKTEPRPDIQVPDGSMNDVPTSPVVIKRIIRLSEAEATWRLTE
jgi:cyclophilin family peptidyl-prolyl cis-trans isomerase